MSLSGARSAAAFATTQPDRLPPEVAPLSNLPEVDHYGVGVCYARTPRYPTGLYWVTVVSFSPVHLASMPAK
jgi:hypothetical protein